MGLRVLADEAIALLLAGEVTEISFGHDFGDDARGTGYDVVLCMEEAAAKAWHQPACNHCTLDQRTGSQKDGGSQSIGRLTKGLGVIRIDMAWRTDANEWIYGGRGYARPEDNGEKAWASWNGTKGICRR